jgi:hypothetical protein
MIGVGFFEKLLEVIGGLPRLVLKITLGSGDELLIGVTSVPVVITFITASGNHDSLGPPLWPPLVASGAPLRTQPLLVTLVDAPRLPPGAAFPLLYMKMAPTASSPEACLVAMLRSSFVVFGWSRSRSCTRVWQFVPNQNTEITSTSQILGSS